MPTVILTVQSTDQASAVLARVQQALVQVDRAQTLATQSATALSAAFDRVAVTATTTITALARLSTTLTSLGAGVDGIAASVDKALAAFDKLASGTATGSSSQDALIQSTRTLSVALGDATVVIDSYTAALARMDAAQLAAAASQGLLSRSGAANLLGGGGSRGSVGGVLATGAALGPGGLAAAATVYAAVKATQAASSFWSAVAQAGAQSDTLQSPGAMQSFGQGLLNYAAGGRSPYSATTLAQGAEVPLASGYSVSALQQAIPAIARLAAQNGASNLDAADQLVTTLASAFGPGPRASGAQLSSYADFASRAETLTKLQPGVLTTALPIVLSALPGTGVSAADATSLLLKVGTVNPVARTDAQAIRQLIQSTQVKPTAGASSEASSIGLAIGPGSAQAYGGILGWIQALQTTSGGNVNTISKILTQKNALSAYNDIIMGGGLAQAAGYGTALNNAGGTGQRVYNELSLGTQQQEAQLAARFNADMVTLGTTINTNVVPHLLDLANAALKGAEDLGTAFTKSAPSTAIPRSIPAPSNVPQGPLSTYSIPDIIHNLTGWGITNPFGGSAAATAVASGHRPSGGAGLPANVAGPLLPGETRTGAALRVLPWNAEGPLLPGEVRGSGGASAGAGTSLTGFERSVSRSADQLSLLGRLLAAQQAPHTTAAKTSGALSKAELAASYPPFTTPNPGMGGLEAGFQNTVVRFGGADPTVATLHQLQQENQRLREEVTKDNQQIIALLAQIARQGVRATATSQVLAGTGTDRMPRR